MFNNYNPMIINQIDGYLYYDNKGIIRNQTNNLNIINSNWFGQNISNIPNANIFFDSSATAQFDSLTTWKWYLTFKISG
jgi:hypothetical protein